MRVAAVLLAVLAALAGATIGGPPAVAAPPRPLVTMGGAPVAEALVADLAYFYGHAVARPPVFRLSGGGTDAGIADASRGVTDAALVTRALAAGDPPGLVLTPLAISAVCLVTNRVNAVPGLSPAQLQDIVAGRITTWGQVAGSPRTDAIVPVSEPPSVGAGRVFQDVFVDDATPESWAPVTVLTGAQERDYLEQTPAGFGYVDLALAGSLHVIPYAGVACDRATVRAGTYPARRPIGIVTRGRPRGALAAFLRWATTSATARRVVVTRYIAPAVTTRPGS